MREGRQAARCDGRVMAAKRLARRSVVKAEADVAGWWSALGMGVVE